MIEPPGNPGWFTVIDEHFHESALYGVFFAFAAIAQLLWAIAVLRHSDRILLLAGAIGNAVVVALWLVTRTVGLPFGPEPWQAEGIGLLDSVATILELLLVAGCIRLLKS